MELQKVCRTADTPDKVLKLKKLPIKKLQFNRVIHLKYISPSRPVYF